MSTVSIVIFLALFIGPMILKGIAAANKGRSENELSRKKKNRRQGGDYDELARRRRAELQQLAQQREHQRQQPSGHIVMDQPDLSTLTMAQRIELARQRAAQKQQGGVDPQTKARHEKQQHAQAQRARQQQQTEQQQQQRRAKAQQRAKLEQTRKQQHQQQANQQRAASQQQSQPAAAPARRRRTATAAPVKDVWQELGTKQSRATQSRATDTFTPFDLGKLDARSLRQAFVMKELLDKPLALRDDSF